MSETLQGRPTLESLFVNAEALPSPPMSVLEVVRESENPDTTIPKLAKLIELDVALAVQIVQMSNSALYSPVSEITTVERALTTLGLRSVRLLALSSSLRMLIPTEGTFDTGQIRQRMVVNGSLARRFAERICRARQDEAFLAGMLTGLGPVVLATKYAEIAEQVFSASAPWPDAVRERDVLGFSVDEITINLARNWALPELIINAIEARSTYEPDTENKLGQAMHFALLAERVLCGDHPSEDLRTLGDLAESELGWSLAETNEWLIEAEPIVEETAALLQFQFPQPQAYTELLLQATRGMQQLTMEANTVIVESTRKLEALSERNVQLQQEAETDALTGLPNRGMFDHMLRTRVEANHTSVSDTHTLGLLMIDLDHFKLVNDTHGHALGDEVLRQVGAILANQTRGDDMPARYGGEEFVILLARANKMEIGIVANRLRTAIAAAEIYLPNGELLSVTASVGGALFGEADDDTGESVLARADRRLYQSKQDGRNTVTLSGLV